MDEATAQNVISRYLERVWDVNLEPKASGPDFLYKGKAIEVKGSNFRISDVASQLSRYGAESEELGLAFPIDALDSTNLMHLHSLGTIWYNAFGKYLEVYLILELEDRYDVLKFSNASDLVYNISSEIRNVLNLNKKEVGKLLEDVRSFSKNLDSMIINAMREIILHHRETIHLYKPRKLHSD